MSGSTARRGTSWIQAVAGLAGIGAGVGLFEVIYLSTGNIAISLLDVGSILGFHSAFAVALGMPILIPVWLVSTRTGTSPSVRVPILGTLAALVLLILRIRVLPATLTLTTLAAAGCVVLATWLGAWLWSRRPWSRRGDLATVGLLVLAAALSAVPADTFITSRPSPQTASTTAPPTGAPDLFLVLVDTLRADHLGLYGYGPPTSPGLDDLAQNAVIFDNAYSNSNWTRPAVASLMTSTLPSVHGAVQLDRAIASQLPLLTEVLQRHGYRTAVFSESPMVSDQDGYDRGADHFEAPRGDSALVRTAIGDKILKRVLRGIRRRARFLETPGTKAKHALEWIRSQPEEEPIFVYLHLIGPHAPYLPPGEFVSIFSESLPDERLAEPPRRKWSGRDWLGEADRLQMIAQYDAKIRQYDQILESFVHGLREAPRDRPNYVVVTSDHGEGFGEHGVWGHAVGLFREITRVPLLFLRSPPWEEPFRSSLPVSLIDLPATLLALAGGQRPDSFQGIDIGPWLRNETNASKALILENPLYDEAGIRTSEWTFWRGRRGRSGETMGRWLFGAGDEDESSNLALEETAETVRTEDLLDRSLEGFRQQAVESPRINLDEDRLEQLRALGYVD